MNQPADRAPEPPPGTGDHDGASAGDRDTSAADHDAAGGGCAPGRAGMRGKSGLAAAIREGRRAALVVNTRSRRGRRLYPAVRAQLGAAGFDVLGSFPTGRAGGLGAGLAAAMDLQPDLLIVGGGDGTISEAARCLAYRDMALGLVPLGTTNNFARTLSIPLDVPGAIGVLAAGKVADVDLGKAGDAVFANLVSAGLSSRVAAVVPHRLKRVAGRAAYPLTALAALPRHRPVHASITAGGRQYSLDTHQLNIANGGFHAGRPITGDTGADDRLLLVYRLGGPTRRALIGATVRHAVLGARRTLTEPAFLAVSELWLDTDPPLPLDVDGEIRAHTPARITLAAQALRVMVAPSFHDT
jgi:diacylglycerol kinase (ATP)